jgi:carbamoyltransferase
VFAPHSLGIFYQALTQYLGFPEFGDEYKLMGLASYGEPAMLEPLRRLIELRPDGSYRLDLRYFRHHREKLGYRWDGGTPHIDALYSDALPALLGPARASNEPLEQRHRDIACSVQALYEEALFHLLRAVHARYRVPRLALAGGCAMNSVANGRIAAHTPFSEVYVPAAPGDAGGAVGAALAVWLAQSGNSGDSGRHPVQAQQQAYWGPSWSDAYIGSVIDRSAALLAEIGCATTRVAGPAELCRAVAAEIAAGHVVGWFQGRMEWGARALGNRSILCDPRRGDMRDILNARIKRREPFRPFAPAILREAVADWFVRDVDVPFMGQVVAVRSDKRALIPAVVHVDGTGRLQTIRSRDNPLLHALVSEFAALTGVPLLLNTSFNENEPIVCRPEEALQCFARTGMDTLVMGGWVLQRGAR